jgi:CheY-like chemotaxis protein
VLLADDDDDHRTLCAEFLVGLGFVVSEAENGLVAVERARRWRPDVILMDLEMPVLGGFEAIALLRENAATRSIPVIVLSALMAPAKIHALGCAAHLVKPCTREDLEGVVRAIVEGAEIGHG